MFHETMRIPIQITQTSLPARYDTGCRGLALDDLAMPSDLRRAYARTVTPQTVDAFKAFVLRATELIDGERTPSPFRRAPASQLPPPTGANATERFRSFIDVASPLATQLARNYLRWFVPHAKRISHLATGDDLLLIAGHRHVENSYTRLLAWALGYENSSAVARDLQSRWVAQLGGGSGHGELRVRPWVITDEGIPDIVAFNETFVLVVEAKTLTTEHEAAGSGKLQTHAYLPAVRKTLGMTDGTAGLTAFVTIRGEAAANPEAIASTFAEVGLLILESVEHANLQGDESDERGPYRALASHWLTHAAPGVDIREVSTLALRAADLDHRTLLTALPAILTLQQLVPMREEPR